MLNLLFLLLLSFPLQAAECQPGRLEVGNIEVLQVPQETPTETVCLIKVEAVNSFGTPHRFYVFDSRGLFLIIDDTAKDQSMKSLKFHSLVFLPAITMPTFFNSKIQLASGDQLLLDVRTGIIDWQKSYREGLTHIQAHENKFTDSPGDILEVKNYPKTWLNYGAFFGKPPESIPSQKVNITLPQKKCQTQAKNFFVDGDFRYQSWSEEKILTACPPEHPVAMLRR